MSLLDLTRLPVALQAALERHFDDDETRRRAVVAPWCYRNGRSLLEDGLWAWEPQRSSRRQEAARIERWKWEDFFRMRFGSWWDGVSMFSPSLPFFPTPLVEARDCLVSPWPDALTDGQYWAFVMQLNAGNEVETRRRLEGEVAELREAEPRATWRSALLLRVARSDVIGALAATMELENTGEYGGL